MIASTQTYRQTYQDGKESDKYEIGSTTTEQISEMHKYMENNIQERIKRKFING